MAVRKKAAKKAQDTPQTIRHARLELPDDDYERLKRVARADGRTVASYIRRAVLLQVQRDEGAK